MLEEASNRGLCQISLEVRASNLAAITLYEQSGFVCVGRRRNFYRQPTEDALVMIRTTDSDSE
jgi:ribosomal-protein-alanine N-acetyltransferase